MIRASDLIGSKLLTASGERLGRVHDLRAERLNGEWRLTGLLIGHGGMVERLAGTEPEPIIDRDLIQWDAVTACNDGVVTVRDGTALIRPPRRPGA